MWWIYQAVLALALLLVAPWLLARRGRHYLPTLRGRLARDVRRDSPPVRGGASRLWIHAVSVGEAAVASALAQALPIELPLVVTTITPTGQERARAGLAALGPRVTVAYLPFDLGGPIERFLDRFSPAGLVLVEGDYWPLLLSRLRRRAIPVAVINGRFSDRSFPRLLRARALVRRLMLDRIDRFGVQTAIDRERLLELGVDNDKIHVTGNLKFDFPEPADVPELSARVAAWAGGRPVLVAGSTMLGEEAQILAAFATAGGPARALLVVAPRHPGRFEEAWALLSARFPGAVRSSATEKPTPPHSPPPPPPIVLLDSIGELASIYRYAFAAFVGGTLAGSGGHNPIEPARFAVPVAVGPSMENFREIAEQFDGADAWSRVASASELGEIWRGLLCDPESAAALGGRGRDLVEASRGATARTLTMLEPLLAALRNGESEGRKGTA